MKINNIYQKLKYNILLGILLPILVLLPDYLFEIFLPDVNYTTDWLFILVITFFGLFLSMSGTIVYVSCCLIFMFMQLVQLGHIAYFSRPINPLDIGKVFDEFGDVSKSSLSDVDDFWFVIPAAVIPFAILIFLQIKWRKKLYFSLFAILVVFIFLGVKPERASRRGLQHFLPPETRYSMHNSINSFSYYMVKGFDDKNLHDSLPNGFYKPYVIKQNKTAAQTVILVMGESTSSAYMHIFNPKAKPNTPNLERLLQELPMLKLPAVSGGVSTHASLPIFFNLMKEPGNINKLTDYSSNLFKMAKDNGYNTYFYSAYDMKQSNLIGVPYIDEMITLESNRYRFNKKREDYLLDLLKRIDLHEGKNFIVLNFRSTHSPYEECYTHHPEFDVFKPEDDSRFAEENAAYNNALLYIDSVLGQMLDYLKTQNVGELNFIFTSDHGEMLGYPESYYGHNVLRREVYEVPFIWYNSSAKYNDMPQKYISHYEISALIARLLGYEVINHNFGDDTFFVHGNHLFEDYEFIKITRDASGNIKESLRDMVTEYIDDSKKLGRYK